MAQGNPVLGTLGKVKNVVTSREATMTLAGTKEKTFILVGTVLGCAMLSYGGFLWFLGPVPLFGGFLAAVVVGIVLPFVPEKAPTLAPIYAVGEGLVLGYVSRMVDESFRGNIASLALIGTLFTLVTMLLLYQTGTVRNSSKLQVVLTSAMIGLLAAHVFGFVVQLTTGIYVSYLYDGNAVGIAFSAISILIAAAFFILDFDTIERGVAEGAPASMEWYCAYALVLTMVWLYLEILRLLVKLARK